MLKVGTVPKRMVAEELCTLPLACVDPKTRHSTPYQQLNNEPRKVAEGA